MAKSKRSGSGEAQYPITQANLVGNGLSSGKIVLSNGQETIDCLWDASNNAFTGNGSITLTNNNNTLTINYLQ